MAAPGEVALAPPRAADPAAALAARQFRPRWLNILALGGIHLGALAAVVVLGVRVASHGLSALPAPGVWATAAVLFVASGLGVTMGYHRYFTHATFSAHRGLRWVLAGCGALAVEGPLRNWVSDHDVHHRFTDVPGYDVHTPYEFTGIQAARTGGLRAAGWKGLAWSHAGWLMFRRVREQPVVLAFRDHQRHRVDGRFFRVQATTWLAFSLLVGFVLPTVLFGWDGLLVAGFVRTVLMQNVTWSVNSVCHTMGRGWSDSLGRTYRRDQARDVRWLAPLSFGETNHGLHHAFPSWAWVSLRPWSFDTTKWMILGGEKLGLVSHVHRPKLPLQFKPSQTRPPAIPSPVTGVAP